TLHKRGIRSHRVGENIRARIAGERIGETGSLKSHRPAEWRRTCAVYEELAIVEFIRQTIGGTNGKSSLSSRVPRQTHTWSEQVPLSIHTGKTGESGISGERQSGGRILVDCGLFACDHVCKVEVVRGTVGHGWREEGFVTQTGIERQPRAQLPDIPHIRG